MLAAGVAGRRQRDDDVGTNRANQPHVVGGDLLAAPLLERLVDAERVAEVDRAREVLLGAVEAVQRGELAGAQHAERLEDLRADLVLAAVAARRGRQRRAIALAAVQHHQQPVVLVVGVRGGVHEDAGVAEVPQHQAERDVPLLLVERHDAHLRRRKGDQRGEDEKGREDDALHMLMITERAQGLGLRAAAQPPTRSPEPFALSPWRTSGS